VELQSKHANTSHSTATYIAAHSRRRAPDYHLATLLGTKEGIQALAEFMKKSGAFQKSKAPYKTSNVSFDEETYNKYYQRYLISLRKLEADKNWFERLFGLQPSLTQKCH